MNDQQALLATIVAQPDQDTPRLAYADWLQENGDPDRADYIRARVAAACLPEGSLLRNIATAAVGEASPNLNPTYNLEPRRGFYEIADFRTIDWLPNKDDKYSQIERIKVLKQYHPLTGIRFNRVSQLSRTQLKRMLEHPSARGIWPRLDSFGLTVAPDAIHVLAQAMNRFKHLVTLDLSAGAYRYLDVQGARAIGRRAHQFRLLKCLNMSGNKIGNEGVEELLDHADEFRRLNSLDLSRNDIEAKGADYLAERACDMPKLRVFSLSGNPIRNAGVQALMDHSKQLRHLESLDLSNCEFGVDGAVAIAAHIHELKGLKGLSLALNPLESEGVRALSEDAVNLGGLEYLDLSRTGMDARAVKALARHAFEFRSLVMLKLDDKFYGDELASAEFPKLRYIVAGNSGEDLRMELRWRRKMEAEDPMLPIALPSLQYINGTEITDDLAPPRRPAVPAPDTEKSSPATPVTDKDIDVGVVIPHAASHTLPLKP